MLVSFGKKWQVNKKLLNIFIFFSAKLKEICACDRSEYDDVFNNLQNLTNREMRKKCFSLSSLFTLFCYYWGIEIFCRNPNLWLIDFRTKCVLRQKLKSCSKLFSWSSVPPLQKWNLNQFFKKIIRGQMFRAYP